MKDINLQNTEADETAAVNAEVDEEICDGDLDAIGGGDGGQPTYPPYV
ncbi:hypothetical protein P3T37_000279 [Kitasatospora sp. MAA4]|nr:hypothetical protein [Kitasatospora sp. MAA4]MDH6130912.1 hypothetical protein [Kitasatospora sp. MAA4]